MQRVIEVLERRMRDIEVERPQLVSSINFCVEQAQGYRDQLTAMDAETEELSAAIGRLKT